MKNDYQIGDIVRFRKKHPCGGDTWEIIRVGMDFKTKCTTCGRIIMLPRRKFEKSVKEKLNREKFIMSKEAENESRNSGST